MITLSGVLRNLRRTSARCMTFAAGFGSAETRILGALAPGGSAFLSSVDGSICAGGETFVGSPPSAAGAVSPPPIRCRGAASAAGPSSASVGSPGAV